MLEQVLDPLLVESIESALLQRVSRATVQVGAGDRRGDVQQPATERRRHRQNVSEGTVEHETDADVFLQIAVLFKRALSARRRPELSERLATAVARVV